MTLVLAGEIMDKQIIDVIHGRWLGTVGEIYYDGYLGTVIAISLGFDAAGNHGVIKRDGVVMFGKDAVLVKDTHVAVVADQLPTDWLSRSELIGTEVCTLEGVRLGSIDDLAGERETLLLASIIVQLDSASTKRRKVEVPVTSIRAISYDHRLVVDFNPEASRILEGPDATIQ